MCVSPGGHNMLVLLYHDDLVIQTVKEAIGAVWPLGKIIFSSSRLSTIKCSINRINAALVTC